jgi:predicted ATPase
MMLFDSFGLDTSNECLWRGGMQINLPPKPFAVLRYLVENPGRLVTHDELLEALWPETFVQPQVLRTYVLDLRKVLGDDAKQPRYIQTLPKRGYCFLASVVDGTGTGPAESHATRQPEARRGGIAGRKRELAALKSLVEMAAAGHRQVAFITGETGIGKTALVDALSREVESAPVSIACGQCVQGVGRKEEYYPVVEALAHLCASPGGEGACRVLARMAPAWLGVLGREAPAGLSPAGRADQERTLGDLCGALEELARERPLILIFEDIHWADGSTLDLISALARRKARASLMVLATFRPLDAASENPLKMLKQDLLMHRLSVETALTPLARSAIKDLVSMELGQEALPPGLSDFVHQHSEGNPLFAIAILEHLIAQQFLALDATHGAAQWQQRMPFQAMEAGVPGELAELIELEIERLSPGEQRLLEAGSLMNVAFPAWRVAAALGEDPAEVEEACDDLARRVSFLNRAGQDELPDGTWSAFYVFAHDLYREVLYCRQAAPRRAARHIRIADRLGEMFAGRTEQVAREMAMHYEAAGSWERAASALRAATRHAWQRNAYSEAEELLERTLKVAENLEESQRGAVAREIQSELLVAQDAKRNGDAMQPGRREKLDEFWTVT